MDRQAFSANQILTNTALLSMEKEKLVAIGYALESIMGAGGTVVSGLACAPTTTPSLSVVVGRGSIMTTTAIDSVAYSDLGTDSNATIKQGILQEPGVTLTLTAPSTPGYSQVYLIQAKQSDADTATTVPFYNASNPSQQYNGPNGSGNATLTLRQSQCVVSLKAGAAAATGSQITPAPDTGNVGLYTITLVNGQTTIQANQIAKIASAPFVPVTLPGVPAGVQTNQWVYATDTGTSGALAASVSPAPTALPDGTEVLVKAASAAAGSDTFNLNGFGALPIVRRGGLATKASDWSANDVIGLRKLGSAWQADGLLPSDTRVSIFNALQAGLVPSFASIGLSGTWTKKANLVYVYVFGTGGGGGGGMGVSSGSNMWFGGPGGGGAYSANYWRATDLPSSISYAVGAGGAAGTSGATTGGAGGNTTFGTYLTAKGGQGGVGVFNGAGTAGAGGTASSDQITIGGPTGGPSYAQPSPPLPTLLGINGIGGLGGANASGGAFTTVAASAGSQGTLLVLEYYLAV